MSDEQPEVKTAALGVLGTPTGETTNVLWMLIVSGLLVILVVSLLGLTHVVGTKVADDKMVTIFTTVLAGLLGLFVQSPVKR